MYHFVRPPQLAVKHTAHHNMPQNTTSCCPIQHFIQHADQHIIMLYIISVTSTCCTAYHSTQYAAQHNIMLYIISLTPICCTAYHSPQYAVQYNSNDTQHAKKKTSSCCTSYRWTENAARHSTQHNMPQNTTSCCLIHHVIQHPHNTSSCCTSYRWTQHATLQLAT